MYSNHIFYYLILLILTSLLFSSEKFVVTGDKCLYIFTANVKTLFHTLL